MRYPYQRGFLFHLTLLLLKYLLSLKRRSPLSIWAFSCSARCPQLYITPAGTAGAFIQKIAGLTYCEPRLIFFFRHTVFLLDCIPVNRYLFRIRLRHFPQKASLTNTCHISSSTLWSYFFKRSSNTLFFGILTVSPFSLVV